MANWILSDEEAKEVLEEVQKHYYDAETEVTLGHTACIKAEAALIHEKLMEAKVNCLDCKCTYASVACRGEFESFWSKSCGLRAEFDRQVKG